MISLVILTFSNKYSLLSNTRHWWVEEYSVVKICVWPLSKWCLLLVIFPVEGLVLWHFCVVEVPVSCAPDCLCLGRLLGLWRGWRSSLTRLSDVFELASHFLELILMHLGTVEVTGIFDFEGVEFVVLFQDLLICQNLLILALKQEANLTLVAVFLHASDLLAVKGFLDLCISFALRFQFLN